MNIIQSIILGIVQGLTEFLPVSSSGHLVLAERILNIHRGDLVFEVMVHLGTLVAVLIYFRRQLGEMIRALFSIFAPDKTMEQKHGLTMIGWLILGTIPAVIFGLALKDKIELAFSSPRWTSGEFIVTGLMLIATIWAIDKGKNLNIFNTIIIGIAQAISIMPAISRSGSTIAAGMFCGVNKEKAAEYSFLLSIPAISGAAILEIPEMIRLLPTASVLWTYLAGTLVSGIIGYLSIAWLLSIIKKGKFYYFGLYCILIGILGLIFL